MGNSGGPLFDGRGRVIGINAQIQSSSGTAEGVGFAVPINSAARSLRQLIRNGRVDYAYVGIETQDVTPGLAAALGLGARRGALVVRVRPGTPAANAGSGPERGTRSVNGVDVTTGGDLIVAIDGHPVRGRRRRRASGQRNPAAGADRSLHDRPRRQAHGGAGHARSAPTARLVEDAPPRRVVGEPPVTMRA